jgi:hypothetical protein
MCGAELQPTLGLYMDSVKFKETDHDDYDAVVPEPRHEANELIE